MRSQLNVSCETFSTTIAPGAPTDGRTDAKITEVHGDLKSTLFLLEDGHTKLAILTSTICVEGTLEIRAAIVSALIETLALQPEQIVVMWSHNHSIPEPCDNATYAWQLGPGVAPTGTLNAIGRDFIASLQAVAKRLPARLAPVTLEYGKAEEKRITYNRVGRRPDGRAYLIREEDRQLLEPGYTGLIDPEAMVLLFRGEDKQPVGALAFFTGHPVTAYNPERPIAFGEWSQIASEQLSEKLGGAPVGFLQGCAGDINSKYMLSGTVAQSREFGRFLGEAFGRAVDSAVSSARTDLRRLTTTVQIPLARLPSEAELKKDLLQIDDFIRRGHAGDPAALECVGMNFPRALSPLYRARLVEMVRPWFVSALQVHREGQTQQTPRALPVDIVVARIGDIGFVALPFEPFVRIGLKIKREASLPFVLTCGYANCSVGYIPDGSCYQDREYSTGFFRYTKNQPPFATPAGDAAAEVAVRALKEISL